VTVQICREELFWEMKIMSKDDDGYEEDHTYRSGVGSWLCSTLRNPMT